MLYSTTLFALASVAAVAGAVKPVSNYESQFLTQTNSLGVVTGQPSKVTAQPALVTSQPPVATTMSTLLSAPGPVSMPPNISTPTSPTIVPPPITPSNNISSHPIGPTRTGSGSGGSTPPPNSGGSQLQAAGVSFLGLGALALAML